MGQLRTLTILLLLLELFAEISSLSLSRGTQFTVERLEESQEQNDRETEIQLSCNLSQDLRNEIASYSWLYQNLSDLIINGSFKGLAYQNTAAFVDTFGSRKFGTASLENSIDYVVDFLNSNGVEAVHTENATIPGWTRGNESLSMVQPRYQKLSLLGLGSSIGTPPDGITTNIIVVKSFEELEQRAGEVQGRIVVYNQPYISYHDSVKYRQFGAARAAQYGGVASLVRSITPKSIYTPHTGWQDYQDGIPKVPSACITIEDAEMFQRMADRGINVTVKLVMEAQNLPDGISRNAIGDWTGSTIPDEIVIVSGHLDSWDVGQGAEDDAGGAWISLMVPLVFKELGLRARRTLRSIGWTTEEPGYYGAVAYRKAHLDELHNFNLVMESDEGTFNPKGLSFAGVKEAACIMQEVLKLSEPLGSTELALGEHGSDTVPFSQVGVPTASLEVKENSKDEYFAYHHSPADMMTVEDPHQLDKCLVFWALTSYVIADLSVSLPRINITNSLPERQ